MSAGGSEGIPQEPEPEGNQLKIGELAAAWESIRLLRRRVKDDKAPYITRWLNPKAINVASVKAMVMNETALVAIAEWWCPTVDYPKAIPIDYLREEAGNVEKWESPETDLFLSICLGGIH